MREVIKDYLCLDIETTGLNPKTEKIIEIGAVRVRNGNITESFESLVAPGRPLGERITDLTGITDEMLKNAPAREEVIPKFLEFAGEDILLGHSVLFDYSFLKKAAVNCNYQFERTGIDTLKILLWNRTPCPPRLGGCAGNGRTLPKAGRAFLYGGGF